MSTDEANQSQTEAAATRTLTILPFGSFRDRFMEEVVEVEGAYPMSTPASLELLRSVSKAVLDQVEKYMHGNNIVLATGEPKE